VTAPPNAVRSKEWQIEGLVTIPSQFGPKDTMDRLEAAIRSQGMQVFARIDHAAGAAKAGLALRPTELLIFGNARAGTPLMQVAPTVAIDLPLKALVWEDASGNTWLSYNEPGWLAQRHGLGAGTDRILESMAAVLSTVSRNATEHS